MTKILELYQGVVSSYCKPFNPDQFSAWETVLAEFKPAELKLAIQGWQSSTDPDFDGRPRGARLPTPADVRAIMIAQRKSSQAPTNGFIPCAACEGGWQRVYSGQTVGWDDSTRGDIGIVKRSAIDKNIGAMVRCRCFLEWKTGKQKAGRL